MLTRIVLFVLFAGGALVAKTAYLAAIQPEVGIELGLAQVNGDEAPAAAMRWWQMTGGTVELLFWLFVAVAAIALFFTPLKKLLRSEGEGS